MLSENALALHTHYHRVCIVPLVARLSTSSVEQLLGASRQSFRDSLPILALPQICLLWECCQPAGEARPDHLPWQRLFAQYLQQMPTDPRQLFRGLGCLTPGETLERCPDCQTRPSQSRASSVGRLLGARPIDLLRQVAYHGPVPGMPAPFWVYCGEPCGRNLAFAPFWADL